MKRIRTYWGMACAAGLLACQKPAVTPTSADKEADVQSVYVGMTLAFSGGSGTRSATNTPGDGGYVTSEEGTEPGKSSETGISEILLVLADANNRNIAAGLLEEARPEAGTEDKYILSIPFRFVKDHTGEQVGVYLFCNPTSEMKALAKNTPEGSLPAEFVDKIYTFTDRNDDPAWEPGRFLMSNARKYVATLPQNWSAYRSLSAPFPLLGDGFFFLFQAADFRLRIA